MSEFTPYFDLHCHPSSKLFLANVEESIDGGTLNLSPVHKIALDSRLIPRAHFKVYYQQGKARVPGEGKIKFASLPQIVVAPIIPGERPFLIYMKDILQMKVRDFIGKIPLPLDGSINDLVADIVDKPIEDVLGVSTRIKREDFETALSKDGFYGNLFDKELKLLKKFVDVHKKASEKKPDKYREARFIPKGNEIEPGKINLLLAIEGAHMLEKSRDGDLERKDLDKIDDLRKRQDVQFLYITLVHTTRWQLCTHAFAGNTYNDIYFYPATFKNKQGGPAFFSELGKELVGRCYVTDTDRPNPLLIDIKHLSVGARESFYEQRRKWVKKATSIQASKLPILATHVGIVGCSKKELVARYFSDKKEPPKQIEANGEAFVSVSYGKNPAKGIIYKRNKGTNREKSYSTYFSPTTINLYDEDIEEVFNSGGLIGLMLLRSRLGVLKKKDAKKEMIPQFDLFPLEEWKRFPGARALNLESGEEKDVLANESIEDGPFAYLFEPILDRLDDLEVEQELLDDEEIKEIEGAVLSGDLTTFSTFLDDKLTEDDKSTIEDALITELTSGFGLLSTDNKELSFKEQQELFEKASAKQLGELRKIMQSIFKRKKLKHHHTAHFANNLLHVIRVGVAMDKPGFDPWEHVCLGSDYGGYIVPLKSCKSPRDFFTFEQNLVEVLVGAKKVEGLIEASLRSTEFKSGYGLKAIDPTTFSFDEGALLKEVKEKVRGIMYRNGDQFVTDFLGLGVI